ncbi:hypothetical protein SprV_0200672200 [Sparganum proliferum]
MAADVADISRTYWTSSYQCATNSTTSTTFSLAPSVNCAPTAIPFTAVHTVAYPPPSCIDTTSSAPTAASTAATSASTTATIITTSRAPCTEGTTSDVPSTSNMTDIPTSIDEDSGHSCSICDRTSNSHIGLVGHLRVRRTEMGEPVPRAPTYTRRICLHCTHYPHSLTYRIRLFGQMRVRDGGIHRSLETPSIHESLL